MSECKSIDMNAGCEEKTRGLNILGLTHTRTESKKIVKELPIKFRGRE